MTPRATRHITALARTAVVGMTIPQLEIIEMFQRVNCVCIAVCACLSSTLAGADDLPKRVKELPTYDSLLNWAREVERPNYELRKAVATRRGYFAVFEHNVGGDRSLAVCVLRFGVDDTLEGAAGSGSCSITDDRGGDAVSTVSSKMNSSLVATFIIEGDGSEFTYRRLDGEVIWLKKDVGERVKVRYHWRRHGESDRGIHFEEWIDLGLAEKK